MKMTKPALKAVDDTYTRPPGYCPAHVLANLRDGQKAKGYMYDKTIADLIYGGDGEGGNWMYADCREERAYPIWVKLY